MRPSRAKSIFLRIFANLLSLRIFLLIWTLAWAINIAACGGGSDTESEISAMSGGNDIGGPIVAPSNDKDHVPKGFYLCTGPVIEGMGPELVMLDVAVDETATLSADIQNAIMNSEKSLAILQQEFARSAGEKIATVGLEQSNVFVSNVILDYGFAIPNPKSPSGAFLVFSLEPWEDETSYVVNEELNKAKGLEVAFQFVRLSDPPNDPDNWVFQYTQDAQTLYFKINFLQVCSLRLQGGELINSTLFRM